MSKDDEEKNKTEDESMSKTEGGDEKQKESIQSIREKTDNNHSWLKGDWKMSQKKDRTVLYQIM